MFTVTNHKIILAILMINIFIVMVGVGLVTPILPELIIEFGASIFLVTAEIFFATAMLRPALTTQLSKRAGSEQGYVAGMNNAYMSVGNILGPTLAGFLFDTNMFALFIAGGCILLFMYRVAPHRHQAFRRL